MIVSVRVRRARHVGRQCTTGRTARAERARRVELHQLDMPGVGVQTGYRGLPTADVGNADLIVRGP